MLKLLCLLIMVAGIMACCSSTVPIPVAAPIPSWTPSGEIPVLVDEDFTAEEVLALAQALTEWNVVLGGKAWFTFEDVAWRFDPKAVQRTAQNHDKMIFLKAKAERTGLPDNILAFANDAPGNVVWLLADRIEAMPKPMNLRKLLIHETGHLLGLQDNRIWHSTMNKIHQYGAPCVDKRAAMDLAEMYHWDPNDMGYCEITTED